MSCREVHRHGLERERVGQHLAGVVSMQGQKGCSLVAITLKHGCAATGQCQVRYTAMALNKSAWASTWQGVPAKTQPSTNVNAKLITQLKQLCSNGAMLQRGTYTQLPCKAECGPGYGKEGMTHPSCNECSVAIKALPYRLMYCYANACSCVKA